MTVRQPGLDHRVWQTLAASKHLMLNTVIKNRHHLSLLSFQNYMIVVSWSDQNNILIYRTFEDFKRFHVSEYCPENRAEGGGRCRWVSGLRSITPVSSSLSERAEEKIPHRERLPPWILPDNPQV